MIDKHFTQQITLDEMLDEVKREIAMRRKVYPNWIIGGKISEETAAFRVLVLEAVQIYLTSEIKKNAPQGDLFR